ncbi:MAG: polysaccharide deacetylase family protein [Parachlamydia sp.]|nr:polysaccharide deacetylase family protein [Parachlamydia sp.]
MRFLIAVFWIAIFATGEGHDTAFIRPLVTLTFDDAFCSAYEQVFPLLKQHQIEATFYIDTIALGRPGQINEAQLMELSRAGHEIGSHTHSHPHLNALTYRQITQELQDSKMRLEKIIGKPVHHFAPPFGEANATVLAHIKRHFQSSRSVKPGFNTKGNFDPFFIRVRNIFSTTRLSEVNEWLDAAKRHRFWLVLVYHQIDELGEPFSTTPKRFHYHLKAIQQRQLATATIGKAVAELILQKNKK